MMVVPPESMTLTEINTSPEHRFRDGAETVFGIRVDGISKAPDNYYVPRDIEKF